MRLQGRHGWIGIDAGASTVKIAQLSTHNGRVCVHAAVAIERVNKWPVVAGADPTPSSSARDIASGAALGEPWLGRSAAAALSPAACDVQNIQLPTNLDNDPVRQVRQIIAEATSQPMDGRLVDWQFTGPRERIGQPAIAVTIPQAWSDRLTADVTQGRWHCRAIDAAPWSLARALELTDTHSRDALVAALDWGHSTATFCLFRNGAPIQVREINAVGYAGAIDATKRKLSLTDREALRTLTEHGVAPRGKNPAEAAAIAVHEAVAPAVAALEKELIRTLEFWQAKTQGAPVDSITMFGGGATIRGISPRLTESLGIPTETWKLPQESIANAVGNRPADCLLGTALGLSALAWGTS